MDDEFDAQFALPLASAKISSEASLEDARPSEARAEVSQPEELDEATEDAPPDLVALQYPVLQGESGGLQTKRQAALNLLNNLLGAGLLAMPRAFASGGLCFGLILMTAIAVANKHTLMLLLWISQCTLESASYPMIGKHVYGQQGTLLVLLAYLLYTGGVLTVYLIALTDIMGQLPPLDSVWHSVRVVLAVLLCAPGAAMKSLRQVAALSAVCMAGVFTLVGTLISVCLATQESTMADVVRMGPESPLGALQAAALFALQFSVQAGGIEVLSKIHTVAHPPRSGNQDEVDTTAQGVVSDGGETEALLTAAEDVSFVAFIVAGVLSGTLGVIGYARFGDDVKGDLLLNFDDSEWSAHLIVARIAYGFVVTCSFAFIVVPCRLAVIELLRMRRHLLRADMHPNDVHKVVTGIILCCCALVAWLVPNLADMLEFVGVWATMALAFILPCAFHMELCRRQEGRRYISAENLTSLGLVVFGVLIIVVRTACTALTMFVEETKLPAEHIAADDM